MLSRFLVCKIHKSDAINLYFHQSSSFVKIKETDQSFKVITCLEVEFLGKVYTPLPTQKTKQNKTKKACHMIKPKTFSKG